MFSPTRRSFLHATLAGLGLAWTGLTPSQAHADDSLAFIWQGEELYYSVEIAGAEAARASIRAGKIKTAKKLKYVPVSAKAITHGFFAKSFPVNDNADTFINPHNLSPIKADKKIREDERKRDYKVRYKTNKYTASVVKKVKGKKPREYDRAVPRSTYDAVSWLYALRSKPFKSGDTYTFYVYDGWKLSRIFAKVVKRDKTWTPLKSFKTVEVEIKREILSSRWKGSKSDRKGVELTVRKKAKYYASIHFTDDTMRIPVRVFATSKRGDSDFKLIKYVSPKGETMDAKVPPPK